LPNGLIGFTEVIIESDEIHKKCEKAIVKFWANAEIKDFYFTNQWDIPIPDTSSYFWDEVKRISDPNFEPRKHDILRSKLKTVGINEVAFDFEGLSLTIVDVGGQISERRKWIHVFNGVNAVIYITALNDYDTEGEDGVDKFKDSICLFEKLSASKWFKETPFILFLNKYDIFEKKVKNRPLVDKFPEFEEYVETLYPGKKKKLSDPRVAFKYIENLYQKKF